MESYTKIKLGVGITLLVGVLIIIYSFLPYFHPNENRGVINAVELVNTSDTDRINALRNNRSIYAVKLQEGGKYFLKLFLLNGADTSPYAEVKIALSKKQFDTIAEENEYWFDIKFNGRYPEWTTGTLKDIYTSNPKP